MQREKLKKLDKIAIIGMFKAEITQKETGGIGMGLKKVEDLINF